MKKAVSLLFCTIMIACFAVSAFAASTTVADLKTELIEVQTKIDKVGSGSEIKDTAPVFAASTTVADLQRELTEVQSKIDKLRSNPDATNATFVM